MYILADSHVNSAAGPAFFRMLEFLANTPDDIVFLGDIFDLWIAVPKYENELHRRFLAWCAVQKQKRSIGLVEGNHEFFVAQERKKFFTWAADAAFHENSSGFLFCHGDTINSKDRNYLLFRKLTKNIIIKTLLRVIPFGPAIAEQIKRQIKSRKSEFRKHMPEDEITRFADAQFRKGTHTIFLGHFHQNGGYIYAPSGNHRLFVLPDWLNSQTVTYYNEKSNEIFSVKVWDIGNCALKPEIQPLKPP
ncbi:MAG: UDP-2,3-diacylglucosamine diphosphatase [Desulfococcaceae bacterium]